MFRFFIFLLVVLGLAVLFAWVADNPGTVFLQWEWLANRLGRPGEEVGIPLTTATVALVIVVLLAMLLTSIFKGVFGMPGLITRFFENRRKEKGYRALSRGLIAASSGDVDTARSLAKESGKLLKNDPLVALLGTQTALLEGNRAEATANFKTMLENDETRMVALRGLFLEAERQGQAEAARHYAEEAARSAPSLPWAGTAKLRYQAADGDWDSAIQTLEANRAAGLIDKAKAKRHRAVLLTAKAMSVEQANPENARKLAKEAHKLAKDLVPAATTYSRAASRLGDIRGASKLLETAWREMPHPELAEAYATVRAGDSVQDRLKRAQKLAGLKANHPEGSIAVAIAAMDARDWDTAREALEPVLTSRPTERTCLLMADIEEGQHGDKGRMRDWLSRAVRAPADEAWTADGHVSEEWMPLSPVTGEIDAFEWKVPVAQLGEEKTPVMSIDELKAEAVPAETAKVVNATAANAPAVDETPTEEVDDEIEDAIVVEDGTESEADSEQDTKKATNAETAKDGLDAENVVPLETATSSTDAPTEKVQKDEVSTASDPEPQPEKSPKAKAVKTSPYEESVQLPLNRRPDDPGPRLDKEPPKKGFKLF